MRLHHTNLRVIDPGPSVAFYRALGLQITGCMDLGASYTLYLGVPGDDYLIELTVKQADDENWDKNPGTGHIALTVDDLGETLAGLAEHGITPVLGPFHPGDRPHVLVCFLEDPTGYKVELMHGDFVPPREPLPEGIGTY